jgi:curved DNA-binding protein CbpA
MSAPQASPSHYDVLQLRSDASADEIRAAWRRLARTHHSDVGETPDDDAMQRINRAYQVLSSPHERAQYDISLRALRPAGPRRHRTAPAGRIGWMVAGLAAAAAFGALAATFLQGNKAPSARPQLAGGAADEADAPLSLVPAQRLESWTPPPGQTRP